MAIKAVVFDAFGTLVQLSPNDTRPYSRLMQSIRMEAWRASTRELERRWLMSSDIPFGRVPEALGFPNPKDMNQLISDLEVDKSGITIFPDVIEGLADLRSQGIKIAVCSNLAQAYGEPVKCLLHPFVDDYLFLFSYVIGCIKPDEAMYDEVKLRLELPAEEILFVGDSKTNDLDGPLAAGMDAMQIFRNGKEGQRVPRDISYVGQYVKYHNKHNW